MDRTGAVDSKTLTPVQGKAAEKTRRRSGRSIAILIAICLATTALVVACGSGSSQPTQAPSSPAQPSGETLASDGATLLETRCSVCHSADRAREASKTHEQWDQTVTRMIGHGAQLTEAEKTVLVDYLAANFAP
jgi:cytochrome c5